MVEPINKWDQPKKPGENLIGIDLLNGFTYIGKSTSTLGDNIYVLYNYIVLPTLDLGDIDDRYSTRDRSTTSPGTIRITADRGLAVRFGSLDKFN